MREPRPNETVKRRRGGVIEYYDELGRNTYWNHPMYHKWYDKKWVRLPNGEDRETLIESSTGYWRRHDYDIHTGELLREIDSNGETNLVNKRHASNPKDTQLSKEYRDRGKSIPGNSIELF
jgi:hypothetical protein